MARWYHPSRTGLRFSDWPEVDQAAWTTAIADGDVLDGRGPAEHWAVATRRINIEQYGRWLGYLHWTGLLSAAGHPADRVRPETVKDYARHLQSIVAPRTVVTLLVGLKVTIKAMAPESDWRWLADICNALNRSAKPITEKHTRVRPSEEIYATALAELDRLQDMGIGGRKWLCGYRNALMIAFLAARPLRLKNFTALEIGWHLVRNGGGWLIVISGDQVKNGQPLEFELIDSLVPYLETYLRDVRPRIASIGGSSDRLWVAWNAMRISDREVYHCIVTVTERLLGSPINPHLFRDCAATSLSLVSTAAARAAAPLLGHQFFVTTERHYVRAKQLEASRTLNSVLSSIKSSVS